MYVADILACPRDHSPLRAAGSTLCCAQGHSYPIVEGVPVLLVSDIEANYAAITRTLEAATRGATPVGQWALGPEGRVDPVVQGIVAATNGILYRDAIGKLRDYPIPELRLAEGRGRRLLDVGCSWGRWSIAAARKGYRVIGIDPDIEAVLAAIRVTRQLGVRADFVVGDARVLPFARGTFDCVFSYSVLQHLAKDAVRRALGEVARVLVRGGASFIQMPNALGVRSAYHIARRRGRAARDFEVRYWRIGELRRAFSEAIGPSQIEVDGFFGLGIQSSDLALMPTRYRAVIRASEGLRRASRMLPALAHVADSVYVRSRHTH